MRKNEPLINRRDFLKLAGLGGGALGVGGLRPYAARAHTYDGNPYPGRRCNR